MNSLLPRTLKICEFNLENLFVSMTYYGGQDLRTLSEAQWLHAALPQLKDRQKPLKNLWGISDAIRAIDADILMLVEVGGLESLENFNRYFLDDAYDVHFVNGNARRGIDLGFLVKKGVDLNAAARSNRDFPIQVTAWMGTQIEQFSRDVAELRLEDSTGRLELILLLTHLKSQISTESDFKGKDVRTAEAFALAALYRQRRAEFSGVPIIVGGDLNSEIASLELSALRHTDLVDFQDTLQTPRDDRITLVHFDYAGSPCPLVLDYLFVSPELVPRIIAKDSFVYRYRDFYGNPHSLPGNRPERWQMPSDHYPLVLTFTR